jgi:sporulation protein YlmC with PRC-barrel domain
MRLELGKPVCARDGEPVGELGDVVVDPEQKRVTHLVVKRPHANLEARLVPIDLVRPGDDDGAAISLRCTSAEVAELQNVEDFTYLRLGEPLVDDPDWDLGVTTVLTAPSFDSTGFAESTGAYEQDVGIAYDRVPKGEVEIRRSSTVLAANGHYVGEVEELVVDDDERITHFVLQKGHFWWRRAVTVPVDAVAKVESDTVTLALSANEVGRLPSRAVGGGLFGRRGKNS